MIIITILYFLLPAAIANMAAAMSAKLFPQWNYPLDFNQKIRGIRIFGSHKTIRGFIFGILCATLIYIIQVAFYNPNSFTGYISLTNYDNLPIYFGTLLGFGAVAGDAIKSFFKRQFQIKPGKSWMQFDQMDWAAGALIVTADIVPYQPGLIIMTLIICLILHICIKYLGFILKLDSAPL